MISSGSLASQLGSLSGTVASADPAELLDYSIGDFVPLAVARPSSADEVAGIMRWANRSGVAVYPVGGRTFTQMGNAPARPGIALDLSGLNRILDFQPSDLTVSVETGVTIAQLDAALEQDGKHVPISAPLTRSATVGGTLATGVSGPLRSAYGLPRDWLIGVTVAGADGTQTKAGGKVVKNVTGYDLNRLYTGSLGTLAVITDATFKLAPAPAEWAVIVAAFSDIETAAGAAENLQSQHFAPLGLHVLTGDAAERIATAMAGNAFVVAVQGGRPVSMTRRVNDTVALWDPAADSVHVARDAEATALIEALTDLPASAETPPTLCVRINAQPSALRDVLAFSTAAPGNLPTPSVTADVGFGGGRLLWWDDLNDLDPALVANELKRIQSTAAALGGGAIVERCPAFVGALIDVWGPQPSGMDIMRRLKAQFDPNSILNPGRFIGGL